MDQDLEGSQGKGHHEAESQSQVQGNAGLVQISDSQNEASMDAGLYFPSDKLVMSRCNTTHVLLQIL